MKKRIFGTMLAAGCSLLLATSGMAADQMSGQGQQEDQQKEQQQSFDQQQQKQTQYAQQLSSPNMLSNAKIQNQQGQEIGTVQQVLLDPQQGNVKFVLMKSKTGEGVEIVPWDALKLQQQQGQQQQQAQKQGEEQGQQGQMTLVLQNKQEQYASPAMFKNAKIQDAQGKEIGTIENTLVDAQEGKLAYVIVKTKTGPQAIVPFNALKMQQSQQGQQQPQGQQQAQQGQQQGQITFVVQGQAPELKEAPEGQMPNVLDRRQGEMIHQYYGVAPYWEGGQQQQNQQQQDQLQDQNQNQSPSDQLQQENKQKKEKDMGSMMD